MQVNQIDPIAAGAAPVHYVIADQNGVAQLPAGIAVTSDAALGLTITQDATGWFFSVPASQVAATGNVTFTDTAANVVGGSVVAVFACSVVAEQVTGLTLLRE